MPDNMDSSIYWNVTFCPLISAGTPFTGQSAGMATPCPLTKVTLFVIQLTRRGSSNHMFSSIYLPLTYDTNANLLNVYLPPKSKENPPAYISNIAGHLRTINEQFRQSGNQNCVIFSAIRQLITIPNLIAM